MRPLAFAQAIDKFTGKPETCIRKIVKGSHDEDLQDIFGVH